MNIIRLFLLVGFMAAAIDASFFCCRSKKQVEHLEPRRRTRRQLTIPDLPASTPSDTGSYHGKVPTSLPALDANNSYSRTHTMGMGGTQDEPSIPASPTRSSSTSSRPSGRPDARVSRTISCRPPTKPSSRPKLSNQYSHAMPVPDRLPHTSVMDIPHATYKTLAPRIKTELREVADRARLLRKIFYELNLARTQPKKYADFVEARLHQFHGDSNRRKIGEINGVRCSVLETEGRSAIREAVRFLRGDPNYRADHYYDGTVANMDENEPEVALINRAVPPLEYFPGLNGELNGVAAQFVDIQGPTRDIGHWITRNGKDIGKLKDRMKSHGIANKYKGFGENLEYGSDEAREIVMNLIIDDGYGEPDRLGRYQRGHRDNIFRENWRYVGLAFGQHARFKHMTVMNFAGRKRTKGELSAVELPKWLLNLPPSCEVSLKGSKDLSECRQAMASNVKFQEIKRVMEPRNQAALDEIVNMWLPVRAYEEPGTLNLNFESGKYGWSLEIINEDGYGNRQTVGKLGRKVRMVD